MKREALTVAQSGLFFFSLFHHSNLHWEQLQFYWAGIKKWDCSAFPIVQTDKLCISQTAFRAIDQYMPLFLYDESRERRLVILSNIFSLIRSTMDFDPERNVEESWGRQTYISLQVSVALLTNPQSWEAISICGLIFYAWHWKYYLYSVSDDILRTFLAVPLVLIMLQQQNTGW